MEYFIAQVNIGKILAPMDSPVMADFAANLDNINALAESSEGFVWRLKDDDNNATSIKIYDDDFIIVNMSVWQNMEMLFAFVYKSQHVEIFKRRKEWFEKMQQMHMCMWYVPAGRMPTVEDAANHLDYIRTYGETPYAFTFKKQFTVDEMLAYMPVR